ncbi:MAG: hypothetical protein DWQ37_02020 [Planctomycetota bacterium]|nr:MAG: hypothetical protein DWQ37_02020 [Planctomycetota bacterium]
MRILLTHHFPLQQSPAGWLVWQWALALQAAGDEVRVLVADDAHRFGEPLQVDRVVCGTDPNADLRFDLPRFSTDAEASGTTFASLSGGELADYRERLRRRLDAIILRFDPHVIHAQHVWLLGQLALESGAPYVLSAWHPELDDSRASDLLASLAEQAAENASRILVPDESTRQRVEERFPTVHERTVVMPPELVLSEPDASDESRQAAAVPLRSIYEAVLMERFG